MAAAVYTPISKDKLGEYGKRGSGIPVGTTFKVVFEGTEPKIFESSFENDGITIYFPVFGAKTNTEKEIKVPLSNFATKSVEGFKNGTTEYVTIETKGLCAEDASYEAIYDAVKAAGANANFEAVGKQYAYQSSNGSRRRAFCKAIIKKEG